MSKTKAKIGFIFDWDGVVVDSSKQHAESWERLSIAANLPLFEGHFKMGFGKRNTFIVPEILKWSQDPAEISRLGELKEESYREIVRETGLDALPGVSSFLASIRSNGMEACVGSSTPRGNIDAVMELIGLSEAFKDIVAAEDVKEGKPHPEVFLKAASVLGIDPARCVVFEDSISGIEAGLAGGMKVVALSTTNPLEELENTGVAFVAETFEEITFERIQSLFT